MLQLLPMLLPMLFLWKKIIIAQYTPEEIIKHSVKGGKSDKIKMTFRKPGLDPTIRLAVKGM